MRISDWSSDVCSSDLITNYYSRMFRLFETHNTRALASQAVWQAGIFGVKSFGPFWEKANSMFFDRGGVLTGEESDSFEKRLGTTEGDILLYGTDRKSTRLNSSH